MSRLRLHAKDVLELYLDDNIIEMYIKLEIQKSECKNVRFIHSTFITKLEEYLSGKVGATENDFEKYFFSQQGCVRYSDVTLIPHNKGNWHWCFFILILDKSINEVQMIYLDPLCSSSNPNIVACRMMKNYLEKYRKFTVRLVEYEGIGSQENGYDCGVFCIEHAVRTVQQAISNVGNMHSKRNVSNLISTLQRWVSQSQVTKRRIQILAEFKQ